MEQFANNAITSLAVATGSGNASITVTSAALFPTTGTFRILMDTEILLVTAVAGNVFSVDRGAEGTVAAAHLVLTQITAIVTKGALTQLHADTSFFADDFSNRPPPGFLGRVFFDTSTQLAWVDDGVNWNPWPGSGSVGAPPGPVVGWTDISATQGGNTATFVADRDTWRFDLPAGSSVTGGGLIDCRVWARAVPALPYSVVTEMALERALDTSSFLFVGWRASGSGKMVLAGLRQNNQGTVIPFVAKMNNTQNVSILAGIAGQSGHLLNPLKGLLFLVEEDATNRTVSIGIGDPSYMQIHQESRTNFLTANEIIVGIGQENGVPAIGRIRSYLQA